MAKNRRRLSPRRSEERSQLPNPLTDGYTKRNTDNGRFVEGKEGPKPFKGVRKEKGK
jgi:hypothetical protein